MSTYDYQSMTDEELTKCLMRLHQRDGAKAEIARRENAPKVTHGGARPGAGRKQKDDLERFAENVALDEYGHLVWVGGVTGAQTPQVRYGGQPGHAKYAAYCLLKEEIPRGKYFVLSDCDDDLCMDPECLYLDEPGSGPKRCRQGHAKDGDWYFMIAGSQLCRGCEAYWSVSKSVDRQGAWILARKGVATDATDYDQWLDLYQEEVYAWPGWVQSEASKVLDAYLRTDGSDQERIDRLAEHARGSLIGLHSSEW